MRFIFYEPIVIIIAADFFWDRFSRPGAAVVVVVGG